MRINPFVFGAMAIAIFLGTIATAQAVGLWSVSGKVTSTGEMVLAIGVNPDEIKGWMTIGDVQTAYGVKADELVSRFGIPADVSPTTQIKELESETFSTTSLKDWLKERQAIAP